VEIDPERLLAAARALASDADALVVEGVGGLLVPLTASYSLRDLAVALGLPVVVAARPGLGTINHTLLAVEAARASGLDVRGVAMTPWPAAPTAIERSNLATVAGLAGIEVTAFPFVTPGSLLPAEARLPLDAWVTP
jgi:dethiobiotin synthetase